mmetsp:Transcript_1446/g.4355  ORF Transcript_1446/g.4355 Transcript_1446/m.4355 type:complete len:563 (-) Transcript_1446:26-1714(-)
MSRRARIFSVKATHLRNPETFADWQQNIKNEFESLDAAVDAAQRQAETTRVTEESKGLEAVRFTRATLQRELLASVRASLSATVRVVAAGGAEFRVSEEALTKASPFFERCLGGEFSEAVTRTVTLEDDASVVETALLCVLAGSARRLALEAQPTAALCGAVEFVARVEMDASILDALASVLEQRRAEVSAASALQLFGCAECHAGLVGEDDAAAAGRWATLRRVAVRAVAHKVEDVEVAGWSAAFVGAVADALWPRTFAETESQAVSLADLRAGVVIGSDKMVSLKFLERDADDRFWFEGAAARSSGLTLTIDGFIVSPAAPEGVYPWRNSWKVHISKASDPTAFAKLERLEQSDAAVIKFKITQSSDRVFRRIELATRWTETGAWDASIDDHIGTLRALADAPDALETLVDPVVACVARFLHSATPGALATLPLPALTRLLAWDSCNAGDDEFAVLALCVRYARAQDAPAEALDALLPSVRLPLVKATRLKRELSAEDYELLKSCASFKGSLKRALEFQTGKRKREAPGDEEGRRQSRPRCSYGSTLPRLSSDEMVELFL